MRNKVFILLLIPLCGTLYAQNINPGKSGGGTSSSSVTNIVNAAQVWTNHAGVPHLTTNVTRIGFANTTPFIFNDPAATSVAIGNNALSVIPSSAADNTAVGFEALKRAVTSQASANTAVGSICLQLMLVGHDNTSVGASAMQFNTNGLHNTAVGTAALGNGDFGTDNVGIGMDAALNTQANENTAVGNFSMLNNVTGQKNSAFGVNALGGPSGAEANTALGYESLRYITGVNGTNVGIGFASGGTQIGGSHHCSFLGPESATIDNAGYFNSTAIGWNSKIYANHQVVIGNSLVTQVLTPAIVIATNGFATILHNTATNTLITVGSSPFNFTNTASQTIVVYLDANGATTTANLNGQTIFKSLAAGDHTIILKPGAYTTVTYAIATPIMSWTEL